jgi:HTH-type transcriptional regulator, cell division transcriptional repressor
MTDEIDWYSPDMATFGDRVAGAREALGLSQRDLAHRLGVRAETLRGWEEDRIEPRSNRLQILAGVLNVSIRWLLTGEGEGVGAPGTGSRSDFQDLVTEMRGLRDDMSRAAERLSRLERRLVMLAEADT